MKKTSARTAEKPGPAALTWLSRILLAGVFLDLLFILYLILTGFPPEFLGWKIGLKNIRKPFHLGLALFLVSLLVHPDRKEKIRNAMKGLEQWTAKPSAIWILVGVYSALFLWQQIAEYLAVDVNFIPFGFYDYILYYVFQGKINYTGWLHGFYHVNNILILLAPLWFFFQSSLFLTVIYGPLAALAALPLYGIAKHKFSESFVPFFVAFVYLNYRYLQNALQMNFCVELFYPLFVFSAVFFALKSRWALYYLMVFLGLLVKEDSFIYFAPVGALVFFLPRGRIHGALTVAGSIFYFLFAVKVFIPATGSTILRGDVQNFRHYGGSSESLLHQFAAKPGTVLEVLFGKPEKIRTLFKLVSRLAFLPLFSPAGLLILAGVFPLFMHGDVNFVDLRFQYAAAVLPFVFIAFVFGFANLSGKIRGEGRKTFLWVACVVLTFANGGHYATAKITRQTLESIRWAKQIPAGANVVTHGHLLPYVGYRPYNYYFAVPFESRKNPAHEAFANADYYLIDFHVNPYPMDREYLEKKVQRLSRDRNYTLAAEEGGRYLFKRK